MGTINKIKYYLSIHTKINLLKQFQNCIKGFIYNEEIKQNPNKEYINNEKERYKIISQWIKELEDANNNKRID